MKGICNMLSLPSSVLSVLVHSKDAGNGSCCWYHYLCNRIIFPRAEGSNEMAWVRSSAQLSMLQILSKCQRSEAQAEATERKGRFLGDTRYS